MSSCIGAIGILVGIAMLGVLLSPEHPICGIVGIIVFLVLISLISKVIAKENDSKEMPRIKQTKSNAGNIGIGIPYRFRKQMRYGIRRK